MYDMFTYHLVDFVKVNVGKYTIHESYRKPGCFLFVGPCGVYLRHLKS